MSRLFLLSSLLALSLPSFAAPSLTALETRWLQAGAPVIAYARAQGLPLDIVVQPQDAPDAVPLALGFANGRCKLVLSMRGNAQAEAVLAAVPAGQHGLLIEAMTAHEIGHCQRYAQGDWHQVPAGFVDVRPQRLARPELAQEQTATRREEGYADLVALAWVHGHHQGSYGAVLGWMNAVRTGMAGGSHDTAAWLALAADDKVFDVAGTPFEQAERLWRQGLQQGK